jgi:hypothetical protein
MEISPEESNAVACARFKGEFECARVNASAAQNDMLNLRACVPSKRFMIKSLRAGRK